jgi:hypothetical protein
VRTSTATRIGDRTGDPRWAAYPPSPGRGADRALGDPGRTPGPAQPGTRASGAVSQGHRCGQAGADGRRRDLNCRVAGRRPGVMLRTASARVTSSAGSGGPVLAGQTRGPIRTATLWGLPAAVVAGLPAGDRVRCRQRPSARWLYPRRMDRIIRGSSGSPRRSPRRPTARASPLFAAWCGEAAGAAVLIRNKPPVGDYLA